jgi:hypothetical protein
MTPSLGSCKMRDPDDEDARAEMNRLQICCFEDFCPQKHAEFPDLPYCLVGRQVRIQNISGTRHIRFSGVPVVRACLAAGAGERS